MKMNVIKTAKRIIKIVNDSDCESPRTNMDNLFTLWCWSKTYNLGDQLPEKLINFDNEIFAEMTNDCLVFSVNKFEHSGIKLFIDNTPIGINNFDTCKIGYMSVSREKIIEEGLNAKTIDELKKIANAELNIYNNYLNGECYQVIDSENELDCGGFYTIDDAIDYLLQNDIEDFLIE